jgi:hypothetical protein
MGREVRRVPPNWKHPRDERGHEVPLLSGSYAATVLRWDECDKQWQAGFRDNWEGGWKPLDGSEECATYAEWNGDRPRPEDYMPDWPDNERTHYQMYETTSEGTPISPVRETPEALARWLADHGADANAGTTASYEAWLRVCRGGYAPSMVMKGGVLMSGVEGLKTETPRE